MAKMRTESGERQPFHHDTVYKTCRRCFEVQIPVSQELCEQCAHIQKLQNFANSIQMLRVTGNAHDDGVQLQAVIDSAKPLARGE